ncbi:hypothetical protein [Actinoplanes sp. G11-F43]|uniref:hypothetical protein n=1 Tax=Actinoplanes sp. G11-F43 TaxID=3424130 RepID=UPI003D329652
MMSGLVQEHVQRLLEAPSRAEAARLDHARHIARTGRRVVCGFPSPGGGWELRDWLTGAVIARGDDGPAGLRAASAGHYDADDLFTDVPSADPVTPGIPPSLHRAIEQWLFEPGTPDQEIAAFVGWPVAKVREHR